MSLLGIDVGTTGCKAVAFAPDGRQLASAYEEYDVRRPRPGWAELDAAAIWAQVERCIAAVAAACAADPVQALAVSSLGEATVAVGRDREVLAPSILNFDARGEEYLPCLGTALDDERLYGITGNTLGNHFGLTKLMWLREHTPALYERTRQFLPWASFVAYMLGAEAVTDYSLANRLLLFDLERQEWSAAVLAASGLEGEKLPRLAPSGTVVGTVAPDVAAELGLAPGVAVVLGGHDQCANALGSGVVDVGQAMWGMGTFICMVPVYAERRPADMMVPRGLNTEHHVVPGRYVSFLYNQGGSLVKWFRDTFAAAEHAEARRLGVDVYDRLFAEMPDGPSGLLLLPHFTATGPPEFVANSSGVIAGLRLETRRGDILKAVIEGTTFYIREGVDALPGAGIEATEFRAVGGGSKSDVWVQTCADILGRPFVRPRVTEAGALGAAILAGVGVGRFATCQEGAAAMVAMGATFAPDAKRHAQYEPWFARYRQLSPLWRAVAGVGGSV
ncbi:MAG: FGGY-family carbohydrate kinase [Anaerolineae bacterium]